MRYWIDTEFIEDGHTIDLISIGIVAQDGRELYAENGECDYSRANEWVRRKVLPYVGQGPNPEASRATRAGLAQLVRDFCDPDQYGKPEFWGYHSGYDWVVLCQLFGSMKSLPRGWPKYCRDLRQWRDELGVIKLPSQRIKGEHHALDDARWARHAWEFLADLRISRGWGKTRRRTLSPTPQPPTP